MFLTVGSNHHKFPKIPEQPDDDFDESHLHFSSISWNPIMYERQEKVNIFSCIKKAKCLLSLRAATINSAEIIGGNTFMKLRGGNTCLP